LLKRSNGAECVITIDGLELPHPNPNNEVLIFLKNPQKEDVPIGTRVWSIDDRDS
jgi:hypothetical protein